MDLSKCTIDALTNNYTVAKLPLSLADPYRNGCKFSICEMSRTSFPVRPRGSWDARAMWIGEAAGKEEEKNCTFIGPAGSLASRILESINLPIDKNFICTNVCVCRPKAPIGSAKENRTPTIDEIKTCRPHLEKIVSLHNPKLIVLVGTQAAKSIMIHPQTIGRIAGKFFGPTEHNLPTDADLYAIWHPAYILRNANYEQEWKIHLVRLRDYMLGRGLVVK